MPHPGPSIDGSRAFGPGSRPLRLAVLAAMASVLAGCGSHQSVTRSTLPVGRVVTASAAHPQLAVEGAPVEVVLASGRALATVTGPAVPPFVAPPPPVITATWTVTLTHVSGSVPVSVSDFSLTDAGGNAPLLAVVGAPTPPSVVTTGGEVTFKVTAVVPTGEGRVHWSPGRGAVLASWDFVAEDD